MIKPSFSLRAAIVLTLVAWLPLPANAGLLSDDEARNAIRALSAKVDDKLRDISALVDTKADKTIAVDMSNQREQLMQELALLRGQIEVLIHKVDVAQKNQNDLYSDLDVRIKKLEAHQERMDAQAAEAQRAEKMSYDAAMELFKSGDYKESATALHEFVVRFPNSSYAANAQYSLGNAYFFQRNYKDAIVAHQAVVTSFGDSPDAPEAMLNIASSFSQLNDRQNAEKTLRRLISAYPGSNAANIAKGRLLSLK
jgi:tol-pal system protein YbgF